MYRILATVSSFCTLLVVVNADVIQMHDPLRVNLNDLYTSCTQFGGWKLCIGLSSREESAKMANLDCVRYKNCVLLFQFSAIEKDAGEHCLYFNKEYRDQIIKREQYSSRKKEDPITLLGARFGSEPISPTLESACFLGDSIDFYQIYYPDKRKKNLPRITNAPAFDNEVETSFVKYENMPDDDAYLVYCCFKQPLILKIKSPDLSIVHEVDLNKEVYLSLYYKILSHNNTLKSNEPFNLAQFKEKATTTAQPVTTTTKEPTTYLPSTTTTTTTQSSVTSDSVELFTTTLPPTGQSTPDTVEIGQAVQDRKIEGKSEESSGRAWIIFVVALVLLTFFLLVAITIYNLLIK